MPTYMDVHDIPGVTAEAVAGAHEADLRVQGQYGVNYKHYWVDEEKGKKFVTLKAGASLASLVAGLNALGVTPRDMISILQTIKAAGALQADIEVM